MYVYIEKYDFYTKMKFQDLLDLRAHKCFWNTPQRGYELRGRCSSTFKSAISEHMLWIEFMSATCGIALRWMQQNTFNDKCTLVKVMAWCCQVPNHYLSQCWPRVLFMRLTEAEEEGIHSHTVDAEECRSDDVRPDDDNLKQWEMASYIPFYMFTRAFHTVEPLKKITSFNGLTCKVVSHEQ